MSIYEVNNKPTVEKIERYDDDEHTFYRFQKKDWEIGTKSWEMIYSSEEEARECYEEAGFDCEDDAILDGKSCCSTAKELMNFVCEFDNNFRVLVLTGNCVGEGHDGEDVVDVDEIVEIWDRQEFIDLYNSMEEE